MAKRIRFTQQKGGRKKKRKEEEEEEVKQIDNIPKYSQQRRSPPPKRRTDFSLFLFPSPSSSSPPPSSSSSSSLSNPLLHQGSLLESSSGKEILSSVSIATLHDKKSKTKEMSKLSMVPCSNEDDRQYFFSSLVEIPILEVESASPTVLKEGHQSSYRQLFRIPDGPNTSNEQDQSCDKPNSSDSSQAESDFLERRRGRRNRKPKVHFDETSFPLNSARKVRRLRIMRFLGLIAPVGSPFSLTHI